MAAHILPEPGLRLGRWLSSTPDAGAQPAIGQGELRALVSAAYDAVTGSDGWEARTKKLLSNIRAEHRTALLTSTISLVERAVRSKSIREAARENRAHSVLAERMLPVGFSPEFVQQFALCLEDCIAQRRKHRRAHRSSVEQWVTQRGANDARAMPPPPPPPPDEPPPDDAHLGAPAGVQPLPSAPVRRSVAKHGVALPGYETARAGDAGLAQADPEPEPELAQVRRDEWGRPIDLTREQAEREAIAKAAVERSSRSAPDASLPRIDHI